MRRIVSIITLTCFLVSSVFAETLYAVTALQTDDLARPGGWRVTETWAPADPANGQPTVINIQDLHCHAGVQRNIARILSALDSQYGLDRVYVEGGHGPIDTSKLIAIRNMPPVLSVRDAGGRIIENLLDSGRLTGAEYCSIRSARPRLLHGIEDERLHRENLARLKSMLLGRQRLELKLREFEKDARFLQARYCSAENRKFNDIISARRRNALKDEEYYGILLEYVKRIASDPRKYAALAVPSIADYPNIAACVELSHSSKKIEFKRVCAQVSGFVNDIKPVITYGQYNELLEKTENLSDLNALYGCLARLAPNLPKSLMASYPDLYSFLDYVEKNERLNPIKLIEEEKRLTGVVRLGLSKDTSELEVSFILDFFDYFRDYLQGSLAADDYEYFTERFARFRELWAAYAFHNSFSDISADFELLDRYYKVNADRNQCFLSNIAELSPGSGVEPRVVVLITGGFHTAGLKKIFRERGIPYSVITPNAGEDAFASRILYEKQVLEGGNQPSTDRRAPKSLALGIAAQLSSPELFETALNAANKALARIEFNKSNFDEILKALGSVLGAENVVASSFDGSRAGITLSNGRTISFEKIENAGMAASFSRLKENFQITPAAGEALDQIAETLSSTELAAENLVSLAGLIPGMTAVFMNIMNFAVAHNLVLGDGLVYEIETDAELRQLLSAELDKLYKMPALAQRVAATRAMRRASIESHASRSELLRSLISITCIRDLIASLDLASNGRPAAHARRDSIIAKFFPRWPFHSIWNTILNKHVEIMPVNHVVKTEDLDDEISRLNDARRSDHIFFCELPKDVPHDAFDTGFRLFLPASGRNVPLYAQNIMGSLVFYLPLHNAGIAQDDKERILRQAAARIAYDGSSDSLCPDVLSTMGFVNTRLQGRLRILLSERVVAKFGDGGSRVDVYEIGVDSLLKVPRLIFEFDGKQHRMDYDHAILPAFRHARRHLRGLVPEMIDLRDLEVNGRKIEWGYLQRRLPYTLGDRLMELRSHGRQDEIELLRRKFVDLQHEMWRRGFWDCDMDPMKNYGVDYNGDIYLIDIDIVSISNDWERRAYDSSIVLDRDYKTEDLNSMCAEFFEPMADELSIARFKEIYSPVKGAYESDLFDEFLFAGKLQGIKDAAMPVLTGAIRNLAAIGSFAALVVLVKLIFTAVSAADFPAWDVIHSAAGHDMLGMAMPVIPEQAQTAQAAGGIVEHMPQAITAIFGLITGVAAFGAVARPALAAGKRLKEVSRDALNNSEKVINELVPYAREVEKKFNNEQEPFIKDHDNAIFLHTMWRLGVLENKPVVSEEKQNKMWEKFSRELFIADEAYFFKMADELKSRGLVGNFCIPEHIVRGWLAETNRDRHFSRMRTLVNLMERDMVSLETIKAAGLEEYFKEKMETQYFMWRQPAYTRGYLSICRLKGADLDEKIISDEEFGALFSYNEFRPSSEAADEINDNMKLLTEYARSGGLSRSRLEKVNFVSTFNRYLKNSHVADSVTDAIIALAQKSLITREEFSMAGCSEHLLKGLRSPQSEVRYNSAIRLAELKKAGMLGDDFQITADVFRELYTGARYANFDDYARAKSLDALRILIENNCAVPDFELLMSAKYEGKGLIPAIMEKLQLPKFSGHCKFAGARLLGVLKDKGVLTFENSNIVLNSAFRSYTVRYNSQEIAGELVDGMYAPAFNWHSERLHAARTLNVLVEMGMLDRQSISIDTLIRDRLLKLITDRETEYEISSEILYLIKDVLGILPQADVMKLYDDIGRLARTRQQMYPELAFKIFTVIRTVMDLNGDAVADECFDKIKPFLKASRLRGPETERIEAMRVLLHITDYLALHGSAKANAFLEREPDYYIAAARDRDIVEEICAKSRPSGDILMKEAAGLLVSRKIFGRGAIDDAAAFLGRLQTSNAFSTLIAVLKSNRVTPKNFSHIRTLFENIENRNDDKYDRIYLRCREQAFYALTAFANNDVIRPDNLPNIVKILTPEKYSSYSWGYDKAYDYFYFPAIQHLVDKGVIKADNLDTAACLFSNIFSNHSDSMDYLSKKIINEVDSGVVCHDNLFIYATLCYLSKCYRLENKYVADLLNPAPDEQSRESLLNRAEALAGERTPGAIVAGTVLSLALAADSAEKRSELLEFYASKSTNELTSETGQYRVDSGKDFSLFIKLSVSAGPYAQYIFERYKSLPGAVTRAVSNNKTEYMQALRHIFRAIRARQRLSADDAPNEDEMHAIIKYFLANPQLNHARLRAIFDIYFNPDDNGAHEHIKEYKTRAGNSNPAAFYSFMEPGYAGLHARQKRKLDYRFLVPFMQNFIAGDTMLMPEAEIFFKLLTSRKVHGNRGIKGLMRVKLNMFNGSAPVMTKTMILNAFRLLGASRGLENLSANKMERRIEIENGQGWYFAFDMVFELCSLMDLLSDINTALNFNDKEFSGLINRVHEAMGNAANTVAGAKNYDDALAAFNMEAKNFQHEFNKKKLEIYLRLISGHVTASEDDIEALTGYVPHMPVDGEEKTVLGRMVEYAASRPEVIDVMFKAFVSEAKSIFKDFRYGSPGYVNIFERFIEKSDDEKMAVAGAERAGGAWEENRYYKFTDESGKTWYAAFTDNFATMLNAGNPRQFNSCQSTYKNAYNYSHGLSGYVSNGENKIIAIFDENGNMPFRRIARIRLTDENELIFIREKTYGTDKFDPMMEKILSQAAFEAGVRFQPDKGNNEKVSFHLETGNSPWDYSDMYGRQVRGYGVGLINCLPGKDYPVETEIPLRPGARTDLPACKIEESEFRLLADRIQPVAGHKNGFDTQPKVPAPESPAGAEPPAGGLQGALNAAILPKNLARVNRWANKGKSPLAIAVRIALLEFFASLDFSGFVERHETMDDNSEGENLSAPRLVAAAAKWGAVAGFVFFTVFPIFTFGDLEVFRPFSGWFPLGNYFVGDIIVKQIMEFIAGAFIVSVPVHVYLDYRYLKASGLHKAIHRFGAAELDENGNVHTNIYIIDAPLPGGSRRENLGVSVDGKPLYYYMDSGAVVVYTDGAPASRVGERLAKLMASGGRFTSNRRLNRKFRKSFKALGIDPGAADFRPGLVFDHSLSGEDITYDACGSMVVSPELSEYTGELLAVRNSEAYAMSHNIFLHMDKLYDLRHLATKLDVFACAGSGQMIVSSKIFEQYRYEQIMKVLTIANHNNVRIYVDVKNDISKVDEYRRMWFAGYVCETDKGPQIHDFAFYPEGRGARRLEGYPNAFEFRKQLTEAGAANVILKESELRDMLGGGERSPEERAAVPQFLKFAFPILLRPDVLSPEFVTAAAYGRDNASIPELPEDIECVIRAFESGTPEQIISALGAPQLGIYARKIEADLKRGSRQDEAQLLQKTYLAAIFERMLLKDCLKHADKQLYAAYENGNCVFTDPRYEKMLATLLSRAAKVDTKILRRAAPQALSDLSATDDTFIEYAAKIVNRYEKIVNLSNPPPEELSAVINALLLDIFQDYRLKNSDLYHDTPEFTPELIEKALKAA